MQVLEHRDSINWETGAVSGATYSTSGNTSQLSNWVSMASKYVQPGVEFLIPSDSGTIKTLSENQLGFIVFPLSLRTLLVQVVRSPPLHR